MEVNCFFGATKGMGNNCFVIVWGGGYGNPSGTAKGIEVML